MTGQAPVQHTGARAACHQGRNYGLAAFSSLPAGALPGGVFRLHSLGKRAFRLCRAGGRHGPTARPCALNSNPLSSALDTPHSKTGNPFGLPVFSRRALWQYPGAARRALKGFLAACGPFHRFLPVCLTLTGPLMGRTRPKRFGPMVPYYFPQPLSVSIKASVHFSGKLNIPIVILYPLM